LVAYGGTKPVSFQRAIAQSQIFEPGITANYSRDATRLVVDEVDCDGAAFDSSDTIACLRALDMQTLLNASVDTYTDDTAHNSGDIWLPAVDGDLLPAAPSQLVATGKFARGLTVMMGWTQDDEAVYTNVSIQTAQDTRDFLQAYIPDVSRTNMDKLLALYPVSEFTPVLTDSFLSAEFYRSARIFTDILVVCEPLLFGPQLASGGNGSEVFLYDWNQTVLGPALAAEYNEPQSVFDMGVVHISEYAYVFANLSVYDEEDDGIPFDPTASDYALTHRGSRSWSTFASIGKPSLAGHDTFVGWDKAYPGDDEGAPYIFVAGGPHDGLSAVDGPEAKPWIRDQKLTERCDFLNSPEMIASLHW
jgi:carboxylesterase type B